MQITQPRPPVATGSTKKGVTHGPTTTTITATSPNMDSTLSLVKQLVTHFVEDSFSQFRLRDRDKEEAFKGKLKVLVYSILLSHRKDHARERSCLRLNELEEVIWHTHVLRQQRRYDDGNALDSCLHVLREGGHLETGSDVRTVMRFLVALKGQGGPDGEMQQPILAELRPRIVQEKENAPCFLPTGPLQYGDTFLQRAECGRPYSSFPSSLYTHLPMSLPHGREGTAGKSNPYDLEEMIRLSEAPPGTGVSPMLTGEKVSLAKGKVLGALLQESKKEVTPHMTLSLPKLPNNAEGYTPFSLSSVTNTTTAPRAISPSCNSGAGGDEGYASSNSAASDSPGDEEDPWEAVLAALPLTNRRTWATLGHIPETKEKPFISEAGEKTSHNIWLLYQELWSIVGGHSIPQLCVRPMKELCQDVLYLLIGVPSHSFPWSDTEECFSIREDLCHSNITPEALRSSLLPLVECGTLVHRLEILFPTPKSDTQQLLTHGSVFTAFTFAISSVLQVHREMVLSLGDETLLSALQDKAQPLVKKIKFVASVCKVSLSNNKVKLPAAPGINDKKQQGSVDESCAGLPRGLCLLGELLHRITTTTDRDCLLLLISIFRSACIPFFRYLEEWIYHGVCSDPGLEFMIEVNGAALLRRDRTYWTSGYTLRPQTSVPAMFLDVLEEAFVCGKTINLLRLCSGKHYLVAGNHDQPHMQLCVSGEELTHMQEKCQHYSANMDLLAAQLQVTVQQKAEEEKAHKHRLQLISSNKHAAVLREIESKMQEHNQLVKEEKAVRLKELKDEMLKAEKRKQEEKEKEAENDWNIAQEQQEIEKRQIEQEEALRAKVEQFYQQKIKEAERAEAVARWRMQRCSLSAVRKHHIQHTSWPPVPEDASSKNMEEEILDLASPQTPDSLPEQPETPDQEQVLCGGALKRPRNMNTRPDSQMHYRAKGCTFAPYHLQTEKSEELLKESPNQEVSSVSDMTASLMSTSSDFVDTPFDENLPDFESDSKIQTIPESSVIENENYAYMKSSIEAILYDNGNGNANLPSSTTAETVNAPPIMLTESPDANANIPETITILETSQNETQQQNTSDNSNTANQNLNELVLQFRERRAQAAAIKEKVLNEYHQTTTASKNNMNILRSRVIPSSAAARNKQRVMETEFGMADTELQEAGGHGMYSRQVSNTSTCSFRSCSSSERPTSSSTAFTTPDEERPILIDQVKIVFPLLWLPSCCLRA